VKQHARGLNLLKVIMVEDEDQAFPGRYQLIYAAVLQIPPGKVASYGDVAALAGLPNHARMAGYALHHLAEDSPVPWHRVVNAQGVLSIGKAKPGRERVQRELLEAEGVVFKENGRVDLKQHRYRP
jgi:methylated-DNA-protein-cysteine methyltransferase-like protein